MQVKKIVFLFLIISLSPLSYAIFPDPPELDTTLNYSNFTIVPLGQIFTGSNVSINIVPHVNKTNPYDLFNSTGLIGRWHLDDDLTDIIGNVNGTLVSNTSINYQIGEFNNATYFNGKTYINTSNSSAFNFERNDSFTVSFWMKHPSNQSNYETLVSKWSTGLQGWMFLLENVAGLPFEVYMSNSGASQAIDIQFSNTGKWADNRWHLYTVTYNGSSTASGINLYIDTVNQTSRTVVTNNLMSSIKNDATTLFGSRAYDKTYNLTNGYLDEIQIWNKTLNQTEINSTYYVKPSNLRVKTNSGIEDWQGNWSNYNSSGGDSPINFSSSGNFDSILVNVPQSFNQSSVNVTDFQRLAFFNITASISPSIVSYIDPTKINASEAWSINATTIKIQGTKNITYATLYWQPTRGREITVVTYQMNSENSTVFSYNFTNLTDGDYPYSVAVNFSDGTNTTLPQHYVSIDFDLDQTPKEVYLFTNNSNGAYTSDTNLSRVGYTFIEPEWRGWSSTTHPSSLLYRCDNVTGFGGGLQTYDEIGGCAAGYNATPLAYTMNSWNPNLVQINRYVNASHYITTYNLPPAGFGYTFEKSLGWAMQMADKKADIVYLNNSKIKIGVDTRYGGMIVYLADMNNLSKNLLDIYDAQGRGVQTAYYDDSAHCTNPFNWSCEVYTPGAPWGQPWGWNPTLAGNLYGQPTNVSSFSISNNSITINIYNDKIAQWNPSYNNGMFSDLAFNITYSFDDENPVVISNFTYTHFGNVTHPAYTQESPTVYATKEFSHAWFKNASTLFENTPTYQNTTVYYSVNHDMVFVAETNGSSISSYGLGIWNFGKPQVSFQNFSLDSTDGTPFSHASNKIDVWPIISFSKFGDPGYTGSNIGRMYVGVLSAMNTYFAALTFSILFDPTTPANQSVFNQNYVYIQANATNAKIQNSTLVWTNVTGTFNIPMSLSPLQNFAFVNMTGLQAFNYSYYITANSTAGDNASTVKIWTNVTQYLFNVSGFVTNASSGLPLSNVTISTPGFPDNITDNSGAYRFTNITNGTRTFTAVLTGYNTNSTTQTINGTDIINANISLVPLPPPIPTVTAAIAIQKNCGVVYNVNNTNLAPTFAGQINGTGERITGVTYFANNTSIEIFLLSHAMAAGQTSDITLYIDGVAVTHTAVRPLGQAEAIHTDIVATIPKGASYTAVFSNYHHYEWREYQSTLDVSGCDLTNNNIYGLVILGILGFLIALICCRRRKQ